MVKGSIRVYDFDTKMHEMNPVFAAVGTRVITYPDTLNKLGLKIDLFKIDPQTETIGLKIQETKYKTKEFIILQAMVFPYINVLWLGCIIMAIGIIIAIVERIRKQKAIAR
jgi:cytochrome c-type biogenesis protein CcmF